MAPTPLPTTTRYIPQGVVKYYWVEVIADLATPTRTEIDAGTDLTCEVAMVSGFNISDNPVDVADACSRFTGRVPGPLTADASSINLYGSRTGDDAHGFFSQDQEGHFLILPQGDVPATGKMDVWPVRVASVSRTSTLTDSQQIVVALTITSEPEQNVAVPAAI